MKSPLHGEIRPPGSKSLTNRALICAALARGESVLTGALESEDTAVMLDSLIKLGFTAQADFSREGQAANTIRINGQAGRIPLPLAELFIANSGTSVRFLTALAALGQGTYVLDGTSRMRERPIQDLLISLQGLGVSARSLANNGCPPVEIVARGLKGGTTSVKGDVSSQFLSALLMVAPYAASPLTIKVTGNLVSRPYIELTLAVMRAFGINVPIDDGRSFVIQPACYAPCHYEIEPDASAASYWFAAAAITGGELTVRGLHRDSLQGDVRFVEVLRQMGCAVEYLPGAIRVRGPQQLRGVDVDMNEISDTVQTLSVVALFANGPTRVRGVAHNRHKETDRIGNLAIELRKLGARVTEHDDGLTIDPPEVPTGAALETYNDHRMAMSFALAGLRTADVHILNPSCVEKTYPVFFEDLAQLSPGCVLL